MQRFLVLTTFLASLLCVAVTPALQAHPAPDGFADLAERLSPAVVNISAAQRLDSGDDRESEGGGVSRTRDSRPRGGRIGREILVAQSDFSLKLIELDDLDPGLGTHLIALLQLLGRAQLQL